MISYKEWKLLHESLGSFPLGIAQKQSIGLASNIPTGLDEMGMMPNFGKKKKNPFADEEPEDDMGDEESPDMDDMDHDHEEMGDEESPDMGDDEEMGDEDDEDMGDEDADDEDMPIDPDSEFEDEMPKKKKFPMGNPHMNGPFMRRMKSEGCGDDVADDDVEDSDSDSDDDDEDMPKGKELSFLQKKQKKLQKKMSAGNTEAKETKLGKPKHDGKASPKGGSGVSKGSPENQKYVKGKVSKMEKHCDSGMHGKKCAKCAKQKKMKESTTGYERPKSYDPSEAEFIRSLRSMFGDPHQKFSDGMKDFSEDMLIPQAEPGPGEVGYAPQTRMGTDISSIGENIQHLMKKIEQLENKIDK